MQEQDRKRHRTGQLVRRGIVTGDREGVYDTVYAINHRDDTDLVYHTHVGDKL
jgi:hypothetical protein